MSTPRAFLAAAITLAMVLLPSVGRVGGADKTEKTTTGSPKTEGGTVAAERGNAKESGSPSAVENELSLLRRELDGQRAVLDAQQARIAELEAHSQQVEVERGALQDELARIAKLEAALNITPGVAPKPAASATSAVLSASRPPATQPAASQPSVLFAILPPQAGTQAQRPEDLSKRVENIEDRMKTFGPFVLSGDFRLGDEPWFSGPADHSLDRNRERYRLRFNVDAQLNSDFAAGFSLATGDVNDPITTNQTATQFYARKPFNLDRAFVVYWPHAFKELTLEGGKFAYPWYNTELTWDKDLNPEGLAQTLAFDLIPRRF